MRRELRSSLRYVDFRIGTLRGSEEFCETGDGELLEPDEVQIWELETELD